MVTVIFFHTKSRQVTHFSITIFFHGHWRLIGQAWKGEDHFLLHSTTSTCSQTFRHLFATMHVRWISHILNRNPCIYQTATRWEFWKRSQAKVYVIVSVCFFGITEYGYSEERKKGEKIKMKKICLVNTCIFTY